MIGAHRRPGVALAGAERVHGQNDEAELYQPQAARLHHRIARAARQVVHERFCDEKIVPVYESYYEEIISGHPVRLELTP